MKMSLDIRFSCTIARIINSYGFGGAIVNFRVWISHMFPSVYYYMHASYTGCIKKKVIELQRAIIRESLGE